MRPACLLLLLCSMSVVFDGGGAVNHYTRDPVVNIRQQHSHRRRHHHAEYGYSEYHPDNLPLPNYPDCPTNCHLFIPNIHEIRETFQDLLEDSYTRLVRFKVSFKGYNESLLEAYPLMGQNFEASEWIWASSNYGRKLLSLPLDADVLSLYILDHKRRHLDVHIDSSPKHCFLMYSPECRLYAVRHALIHNVTYVERLSQRRDFVCHRVVNESSATEQERHWHVVYRCCDTTEFRNGEVTCYSYTTVSGEHEIRGVQSLIQVIAALFTLFSPIVILRIKIALKFDAVTKFFRASLKHGITGQRNYVIRISSRQLINLNDPKPFSLPRFLFRLLIHCYGEGRCCIHWWGDWPHQPRSCRKDNCCQRFWFMYWRIFAVIVLYPLIIYLAILLYLPRLGSYIAILDFMQTLDPSSNSSFHLDLNLMGVALIPLYSPVLAMWGLFAFVAFIYTVLLLSWPNNPLERCLLRHEGKKTHEGPQLLYDRLTQSYQAVLHRLAYGDHLPKQHFFRIRCLPWGLHRTALFIGRVLMQVPVINMAFTMLMYDNSLFSLKLSSPKQRDETEFPDDCSCPSPATVCKWAGIITIWTGFLFLLSGYCTAVFLMAQFVLNVAVFTLLGVLLYADALLPWLAFVLIIVFYIDDTLTIINEDHQEILRLIDENSPRISAVEDTEDVFRPVAGDGGAVHILRTHNLGAVKFIDGDNTEYVSKELYYSVCGDLKVGWGRTLRHLVERLTLLTLYTLLVFLAVTSLASLTHGGSSGIIASLIAAGLSLLPHFRRKYGEDARRKRAEIRALWAKIMPDILDRHIRVDRTLCVDEAEEELTTYDVRPVGVLEMEVPREVSLRALRLWKFPWIVSSDQQTHTTEGFIVALSTKLAAAGFLSKVVTRAYSADLYNALVLRQWCLLVENCIMEGSATAASINGVPVDSVRLFPRDVQPLVQPFSVGNTVDSVVDCINRELYGPFTKGVLVTIGNTSFALGKLDNMIFAFNGSCHGEQVTDLFGAVLIMADFNTQNLQTTIKYIIDPYSPDTVPVYTIVPTEGFVFRSPEILELESNLGSP